MKKFLWLIFGVPIFIFSCKNNSDDVTKPTHKDITEMVFASGVLESDDQYNLTAQTNGYIVKENFEEGDLVQAGQVLAVIDNSQNVVNSIGAAELHNIAKSNVMPTAPALQQIKANIEAAKEKLKLDKAQLERYTRLYATNSISKLEFENAQLTETTSEANLQALQNQYDAQKVAAQQVEISQRSATGVNEILKEQNQIKALHNSKVYQRVKLLGDYVRQGDVIAVLGNPKLIYAKLNVDETSMSKVHLNQKVLVRLNTNKQKVYNAVVKQVLPMFDQTSLSYLVKAYFTDSLDFQIVGTQLESNIVGEERKNVLVIPRTYLDYGNKVMLKKGKKIVTIQVGLVSNDYVEVLGGIGEEDELMLNNKK